MVNLSHEVLSNAGWSAALALGAALAGLVFRQRPALIHGLWVLVLLKLVTPSLVHLTANRDAAQTLLEYVAPRLPAEIPSAAEVPRPTGEEVSVAPRAPVMRPASAPAGRLVRVEAISWPWRMTVFVLWLCGVAAWWSAVGLQVFRFRRLLRAARPAPDSLRDRAGRLATRLGLHHGPAVWLVPAVVPPMLWAPIGPPMLLLPEGLWNRLDEQQQDTVLAHELAHLRRRDHWVRWLEAVVLGFYWWYPVAWWARRKVEHAEEQCCDSWVLWAVPDAAEAYAEALVATAVFLSGPRTPWPVGATGVNRVHPLRRRLSMILRDPKTGLITRPAPRAALIVGSLSLLLLPAWARGRPPESARSHSAAQTSESASLRAGQKARSGEGASSIPEEQPAPGRRVIAAVPAQEQKVTVSQPLVREVSDYEDFAGRVEAARTIEIRARVGGVLVKVHPQAEGVIEKGSLLFEIDPRPYQAELDRADAAVKLSEVQLKSQSAALQRAKPLLASGAINHDEFDLLEVNRAQAEASLQAARATRELARLKLDFTKITAPARGKLSRSRLGEGELVVPDTSVLATIDSSDPMYVSFDIDERTFLRLSRKRREGHARSALESGLPVLVGLVDEEGFPRSGRVDSVGTRFDPDKGTLPCRAVVPNPDGLLLPGLFARIRLITGAPSKALLVAEAAVLSDEGRRYVFVVNDQGVIEQRPIRLGELHDDLRVVKEGLKEGEWVVVAGLNVVKAGMTVKPEQVAMPTRSSTLRNGSDH